MTRKQPRCVWKKQKQQQLPHCCISRGAIIDRQQLTRPADHLPSLAGPVGHHQAAAGLQDHAAAANQQPADGGALWWCWWEGRRAPLAAAPKPAARLLECPPTPPSFSSAPRSGACANRRSWQAECASCRSRRPGVCVFGGASSTSACRAVLKARACKTAASNDSLASVAHVLMLRCPVQGCPPAAARGAAGAAGAGQPAGDGRGRGGRRSHAAPAGVPAAAGGSGRRGQAGGRRHDCPAVSCVCGGTSG